MRVVVVGAGLAGLRATTRLAQAGVGVTLLEGLRRVGGRVRTMRTPFVGGQYVESGAEWVDDDHPKMLELVRRCGAELMGDGMDWTALRRMLFRDHHLYSSDDLRGLEPSLVDDLERYEQAVTDIADGILDPSRPDLHPDAAFHDARSLADLAAELCFGPVTDLLTQRNSQGEFAAERSDVSLLFVAQQRAVGARLGISSTNRSYRVVGGLDQVAAYLAAEAGARLSQGEPAMEVSWSNDHVEVVTPRRTIAADHVVLACSLPALRRIRFTPELPPDLACAIAELGYGTVTKTAVQYGARSWPQGFVNTTQPSQRVYEPTVGQPGDTGALMAYTGGAGGHQLAELAEDARIAQVVADQHEMHGFDGVPLGAFSRAWSTEPSFGGSYAVYRPGQVTAFWDVLRRPCGRLRLAGEHVATWTGYMEGAVETGDRVADEILAG